MGRRPIVMGTRPRKRSLRQKRRSRILSRSCSRARRPPGMALALPSGGFGKFEGGRLLLRDPRDIAALRRHQW
jgi:hypothetical protein